MSASYPAAASWNNLPSELLIGIIAGTLIYVKSLLVFLNDSFVVSKDMY